MLSRPIIITFSIHYGFSLYKYIYFTYHLGGKLNEVSWPVSQLSIRECHFHQSAVATEPTVYFFLDSKSDI